MDCMNCQGYNIYDSTIRECRGKLFELKENRGVGVHENKVKKIKIVQILLSVWWNRY